MLSGEIGLEHPRSWEYGSWIIEAREKDVPHRIHGNVLNSNGDGSGTLDLQPARRRRRGSRLHD